MQHAWLQVLQFADAQAGQEDLVLPEIPSVHVHLVL